jgi:mannose-6-phosphate isomerase
MAVEVMPPGDNVVRGGLTSKHVDGIGLADVVDPVAPPVAVQRPAGPIHSYDGPTDRILVRRITEARFAVEQADGPHLVLGAAGATTVRAASQVVLGPGEALEVPVGRGLCTLAVAGEAYLVTGASG